LRQGGRGNDHDSLKSKNGYLAEHHVWLPSSLSDFLPSTG